MELYLHIPFCVRKCKYCTFVSFSASEAEKDAYVGALLREAEIRREEISEPIRTVYLGGGTPSLLSPEQLRYLIAGIRSLFPFAGEVEFSVEANPGTLTDCFLQTAVSAGVNRLSLGMQAFQPGLLKFLGRIHTFEEVQKSVEAARSAGLCNLNLDLIFGIPGQSIRDWKETLDAALSLSPEHISAYGLIPEEGTPLFRMLEKKEAFLPDPDLEREMYDLAIRKLGDAGLKQYEISNFARDGYECRHNTGYWTLVPYVGLGLSAASMLITGHDAEGLSCLRKTNPSDPAVYREMIRSGDLSPAQEEKILPNESRFETMMLGLRMNRGVSESAFEELHGMPIQPDWTKKLENFQKNGLMKHEKGAWFLTRRGMDIQNSILLEFMQDSDSIPTDIKGS